jgi:hypothetical protein
VRRIQQDIPLALKHRRGDFEGDRSFGARPIGAELLKDLVIYSAPAGDQILNDQSLAMAASAKDVEV